MNFPAFKIDQTHQGRSVLSPYIADLKLQGKGQKLDVLTRVY
jgi:hypothetical protein